MDELNKYNGWTNYETWACHLHLTNDDYLYNTAKIMNARLLESYVYSLQNDDPFLSHKPMFDDIGSIWRVNFREIAESFLEDSE